MPRYLNTLDPTADITQGVIKTDFGENADAGINHAWHNMMSVSESWYTNKYQDEEAQAQADKAKALGVELPSIRDVNRDASTDYQDGHTKTYDEQIRKLRQSNPDSEWLDYEELNTKTKQRVLNEAKKARTDYNDISGRAGLAGSIGGMAGIAGGALSDPVNIAATLATLPLALEGWGAVIGGNALIGGLTETAVQYAPGGVRDWGRKQGLTDSEVNDETGLAIGGAVVGGGAFAGVLHGGGKAVKALAGKVMGKDRNAARTAADELLAGNHDLTTEQRDMLTIIRDALGIENDASPGVSTRMSADDAARMAENLKNYVQVSEAISNDNVGLFNSIGHGEAVDAISARIDDIQKIFTEIEAGRIGRDNIDPLFRAILSDDQYTRFGELVAEYKSYKPLSRLDTLSKIEAEIASANDAKAKIGDAPARAEQRSNDLTKAQKEHGDLTTIVDELAKEKARLEKELSDAKIAFGSKGTPKPEVLTKVGVSEQTATRIRDIEERLLENISKKERGKLEAELKQLMEDPSVIASKDNLKALIDDIEGKLQTASKDLDGFKSDMPRTQAELDRTAKLADKASRQADGINTKIEAIDTNTGKTINDIRDMGQRSNELWSNAEIHAAMDILDEVKSSDFNKLAFTELVKLNGTASSTELRQLAQFGELRNRLHSGENLSIDDFAQYITPEQRSAFATDLKKAVDEYWNSATAKLGDEGKARIENAANHIRDIMQSTPSVERFSERINIPEGVSPEVHYQTVREFSNDRIAQERLDRVIDEAINTEWVYPDTPEGRVLRDIEAELKGMADEVKQHEDMADLLDACKA